MGTCFSEFSHPTPPHIVLETFTFKTEEQKDEFLNIACSSDGLRKTREFEGCRLIECLQSHENPCVLTMRQEWDSRADHEKYFKMQVETGMIDALKETMDDDIDVKRFYRLCV